MGFLFCIYKKYIFLYKKDIYFCMNYAILICVKMKALTEEREDLDD